MRRHANVIQSERAAEPLRPKRAFLCACIAGSLVVGGCGSDDVQPPPPPKVSFPIYDALSLCNARVPTPTDLFRDDNGLNEQADCDPPSDPVDAAIFAALVDEGAPVDSEVVILVEGTIDPTSFTSTGAFSLTGGAGTSTSTPPPPTLILAQTGASTAAGAWAIVPHQAVLTDGAIRLRPSASLEFGATYFAVTTSAIRDDESPQNAIVAAEATKLLVGATPIVAGAVEGLDGPSAVRLERERLRLQAVVRVLATAAPPVTAEAITSIQRFTTQAGFLRARGTFDDYHQAVATGRYGYEVTSDGRGDIPPAEIYSGLPPAVYSNILAFRAGTVKAPRLLSDDGRIRDNWRAAVQEVEIPFLLSIPKNVARYPVVLFVPGFGRGKIDARAIANEFAGGPQAAVMAIELRCHGDRSPGADGVCGENRSPTEVAALADSAPNNQNPELVGADTIPDASGVGFFPGDAQALRDSQVAAAVEIAHVLEALRDTSAFTMRGINPNQNEIHLIAQGHAVPAALLALALTTAAPRTVQFPSGGAGFKSLILDGPAELRTAFESSLPVGVAAGTAAAYLDRLEASVLTSVSAEASAPLAAARYSGGGMVRRILLNHPSSAQFVSEAARQSLIDAVGLAGNRVSRHNGSCDDFFTFTCTLGDNPAWVSTARQQMVAFMDSGGVTVIPPAQ